MGPTPIKGATENFVVEGLGTQSLVQKETMEALHARCKEFNYEMDSVMNLSSDVSQGMPEGIDLKSFAVFDEAERQRRLRMHCNILASFVASNFLSPNGYLAYTCNLNAMAAVRDAKKQGTTNFLEVAGNRVEMQSAMNMAGSRSF